MVSKIIDLLQFAKSKGIHVLLNDGNLKLKFSKDNVPDPKIIQEIRDNKELILDFLNGTKGSLKVEAFENELQPFDRSNNEYIPLSYSQERLWFINQLAGSVQYHMPIILNLKGILRIEVLEKALKSVVDRHEILRTVYAEDGTNPYQIINTAVDWKLEHIDGSVYTIDSTKLNEFIQGLIYAPFNLAKDYMLKASLVKLAPEEHILVATVHHIAADGTSIPILIKEFIDFYESAVREYPATLEELKIQYADFAIWQRKYLSGAFLDKKLEYWKKKLNNTVPLQLPTDFHRPEVLSNKGAIIPFSVDEALTKQLLGISQTQDVTLFMLLLSVFKVLLYRYSGETDICVGAPTAGRQHHSIENLIGFFINTLVLRTDINPDSSFVELLQSVKTTTLEAYENQEVPFERIVEATTTGRDLSQNPLFQVMFVFQNTQEVPVIRLSDLEIKIENSVHVTSKFDLTLIVKLTQGVLHGSVEFNTDLYKPETIDRLIGHFTTLLNSIAASPQQMVSRLMMLSKEELQRLESFNYSNKSYPLGSNIISLFKEQVIKSPSSTALVFEGKELTYKELNERSNQLACYLGKKGVTFSSLVPICIERGLNMVVGILGILKSGAAYVPIDPKYPQERINYMLADTAANFLIASSSAIERLSGLKEIEVINLDQELAQIGYESIEDHPQSISPHDLAYVIYTSGSTGRPKGVMIEHRGVVNLFYSQIDPLNLRESISILQFASFSFDASCYEIFCSLLSGGKLILVNNEILLDRVKLGDILNRYEVELITVPPTYQSIFKEDGFKLKTVVSAGEMLNTEYVLAIQQKGIKVINAYGPTENTVCATLTDKPLHLNGAVSIGKPIANTSVNIVDKHHNLLPIGIPGEIFIGGLQVARGYLNLPELTAEKFIIDPFDEDSEDRLYKTGDLGRWLPDGNIEYLGRIDDQVKIRGYRIELGEIEQIIQQSGLVNQVVVIAREDAAGIKRLISYVSADNGYKETLLSYLQTKLPDYMIPGLWVSIETFPLTPNGKIDRKALPDPDLKDIILNEYTAPRTPEETVILNIWKELLGMERIGVHDNFFELGGHSLLAMRVISSLREAQGTELQIRDLFLHPTIAGLATLLTQETESIHPAITAIYPRPEKVPLSFSQERLWFIDQLDGSVEYHIPAILNLKGSLNIKALEYALKSLVERHEVLRTVILQEEGVAWQQVQLADDWSLNHIDNASWVSNPEQLRSNIQNLFLRPFHLSSDFMLRADIIGVNKSENILVLTMHHIASDGWSIAIIVKELVELYNSYGEAIPQLAVLPIQYADFSIWERNFLTGPVYNQKLDYWRSQLLGVEPLELPTDFVRPASKGKNGDGFSFKIDKNLSNGLNELSRSTNSTLFMTLLSAFKVLLHRYSNQTDICVGSPIAGRNHKSVEGMVGFFVNTLALRSNVDSKNKFVDLVAQVRSTLLDAYSHQEIPFEKVVDAVVKDRDQSRSPLFQVMFTFQNTPEMVEFRLGDVELSAESFVSTTVKFELGFTFKETQDGIWGNVEYSTDLYNKSTIQRMVEHFNTLLASIINNPNERIGRLKLLPAEEKIHITNFNSAINPFPGTTVLALFEQQVMKSPNATALILDEAELTYAKLDEDSNRLAHYLISKGVKSEVLVPICLERSFEMIVGILGILKAGGTYVPIDPEYPQERIKYILEDTAATLLLGSAATSTKIKTNSEITLIELDGVDQRVINNHSNSRPQLLIKADSSAYVIYTSGSTGKPKGVITEHASLSNLIQAQTKYFDITDEEKILQFSNYAFDASVEQIFLALCNGAQLILFKEGLQLDIEEFESYLNQKEVSHLHATPLFLEQLKNHNFKNLKRVIAGGDVCRKELANRWKDNVTFYNEYGPTETTVTSIEYLEDGSSYTNSQVPIGKSLPNTQVYIVDDQQNLVPIGIFGELYIGGLQVARGYLNMPEETKEKFIDNTFSPGSGRLYKTGDYGRWLPDGNIEYLGRKDNQVKIRGHRIELGEIESMVQQSALVSQNLVLARKDKQGNKRLVGYAVVDDKLEKTKLTEYLLERLPPYMVPNLWVELVTIPLNSNGKVDYKALPEPEFSESQKSNFIAPRNPVEIHLVAIWKDLLDAQQISTEDNFFELGGDSILTIQVVSRMRRLGYEVQPKDLFTFQTIAGLSAAISERTVDKSFAEQGILSGSCDLLPIQQRYLDLNQQAVSHFNQSILIGISKQLNGLVIEKALQQLVLYHDALRFSYALLDGKWQQHYGLATVELLTLDLSDASTGHLSSLIENYANDIQESLDIHAGIIVKFLWIKTPDNESHNRLLFVIHHLAIDGVSWRILLEDLELLLTGVEANKPVDLGQKSSSYRQWANALYQFSQERKLLSERNYWLSIAENSQGLKYDKLNTGKATIVDMAQVKMCLGVEHTKHLLHNVSQAYHTEITDILMTALAITLCDWIGSKKIVVGLEGHGREHLQDDIDTSRTVGWFTTIYPVLLRREPGIEYGDLIKSIKEQNRQIPDKGIGYGVLKYIAKEPLLQQRDPWDIVFNYLGQVDNVVNKSDWFTGASEAIGTSESTSHEIVETISVNGSIKSSNLCLTWRYSTAHFEEHTLQTLVNNYQINLIKLIEHCIDQADKGTVYTPSDFGLGSDISYQELDNFLDDDDTDDIMSF
jgi:amino acid adenylation domain-containing protein/non-ribosomal peptide synthase protein (TIGR01720 family)